MDGIFTLPYSEFSIINTLNIYFKKYDGFSIFVPTSRQQKGIDFIILNTVNKKVVTVQVKSSRVYLPKENSKSEFEYFIWLNNFLDRYSVGTADFYFIYGLYPVYTTNTKINSINKFWKEIILCYDEKEMFSFLKKIKTKQGKPDKFFGYGFNKDETIFALRGLKNKLDVKEHLLKYQIEKIKNYLL